MNKKQTIEYIEYFENIMNTVENLSTNKLASNDNLIWMLMGGLIVMQTLLYKHLDNLTDAEINRNSSTLHTDTVVRD